MLRKTNVYVREMVPGDQTCICMGRAPDGKMVDDIWLKSDESSHIQPAGPGWNLHRERGRAMMETRNLTHLPAAPWCECVQTTRKSDWHIANQAR